MALEVAEDMTPRSMMLAADKIRKSWPHANIYPNIPSRNPMIPTTALAVDHDSGNGYQLVAWVDILGHVRDMQNGRIL